MYGEFKRSTVMTLASRAANMCSNPDCLALTSGPSSEDAGAVNVGEAAHIFGGKPGAARWDPNMTDEERADPTNGIWLCRICHKKIDADPAFYPSGLMFEWKRAHESHVLARLGKASDMRARAQERLLSAFPEADYLAEQTILDKPINWEYKLTAQLLRQFLDPLHARLRHLIGGFYSLPLNRVKGRESVDWILDINTNVINQIQVLSKLVTKGFEQAWGEPGVPGSDVLIYIICKLLRDACARCIEIEECIRFTKLDDEFSDVSLVMEGTMAPSLEKIFSIQPWLASIFSDERPQGEHELKLVFELPRDWQVRLEAAMKKGMKLLPMKN